MKTFKIRNLNELLVYRKKIMGKPTIGLISYLQRFHLERYNEKLTIAAIERHLKKPLKRNLSSRF